MTTEISFSEVKKHKSKKSLWMVIHNDVYDVTQFIDEHPGGEDTLLEVAGKDGTQAFEEVGHSEDAREILNKFKIGTLPAKDKKVDIAQNCCKKCLPPRPVRPPCPSCQTSVPKRDSKTWRTYDGTSCSQKKAAKSPHKTPKTPKVERRVDAVVVPTERRRRRRRRPPAPPPSNTLKWALLALAGAIIIGIVLKKTMG